MNEIVPVNGHLLVKPVEHKSILPSEKGLYEEIGEIIEIASDIRAGYNYKAGGAADREAMIHIGDKVFFDGWRSAKYPTGNDDEFITLVRWEDVRAVQKKDV